VIDAVASPVAFRRPSAVAAFAASRSYAADRLALVATAGAVALLPLAVPTGPANLAPIDAFVVLAIGVCLFWAGTERHRWRFPYVLPVGLMLIGGALGALIGPVPGKGIIALGQDLLLLLWCWAVVNISHSPRNLKILLATWAYSAIGWAILAFIGLATHSQVLTGEIERQGTRLQLTLADPSYTANYFFISMMIMWATRRPTHRAARLTAYAMLLAAIAATGSNSGMVAVVVGTAVATVLGIYRRFGIVHAVTALAFLALGASVATLTLSLSGIQERAHDSRYSFIRQGLGRSPDSAGQREMILQESVQLYKEGSLLGEGPVSTKPRIAHDMGPLVKEAHDDYFAALIERGPIGFAGILLLVAALAGRGLALSRRRLAGGFAAVVTRPNAVVGAVMGTLIASTVYELLHVRHVWALFAFVAALYMWGREGRSA
jgi:O-Antigen ligase